MIKIRTYDMGHDRVFLVTGGTAHIGATATAYPASDGTICADAIALPGHRERELALELAAMAAAALGRAVAVLVGIHLDRPSQQEIAEVVEEARQNMREILALRMAQSGSESD